MPDEVVQDAPAEETPEEKQARLDARAAFDYKAHVAEQGANLTVHNPAEPGNTKPMTRGDAAAFPPAPAGHYNPPVVQAEEPKQDA